MDRMDFFFWLRLAHQKALALNLARGVWRRIISVRHLWTVVGSSCLLSSRSSSARIMSQLALSYLSGRFAHSRHWISEVIDSARCSPEGMLMRVTPRLVLLLEMARSRVVPVGWELEGGG